MAFLEMNLPPIPLHASTQTNNCTLPKVLFLEKAGISRVVLARELSLSQIKEIRANTSVELESFIHGALCVSYSGQCYMSALSGCRSGNRGECAQPCRLSYSLTDSNGNNLAQNKHLLSLKDFNLSYNLSDLIATGVSSLKIEGRLKDINYVKNITAFYRKKVDAALNGKPDYQKSSIGKLFFTFEPDVETSFNRGFSTYFIEGRKQGISNQKSPKALGKLLGKVNAATKNYFSIETKTKISNGDGLCFYDKNQVLSGLKVNKVEENRIYPNELNIPIVGTEIYRNHDHSFEKLLNSIDNQRKIEIQFVFSEIENGFELTAKISDGTPSYPLSRSERLSGYTVSSILEIEKEDAKNEELALNSIKNQLQKAGDSIFEIVAIQTNLSKPYFIPAGKLNELRRSVLQKLENELDSSYQHQKIKTEPTYHAYPEKTLDYRGNVSNRLAAQFYKRHGVELIQPAIETQNFTGEKIVMTTKLCLKYELKICPKYFPKNETTISEPLFLTSETNKKYKVDFDCEKCEMNVKLFS